MLYNVESLLVLQWSNIVCVKCIIYSQRLVKESTLKVSSCCINNLEIYNGYGISSVNLFLII